MPYFGIFVRNPFTVTLMKIRKTTLALLTLLLTFSLFAQDNNSLLWEISGNGLKAPSYLFGSIHLSDKRVFDLPDSVLAKLRACEVSAFELNLDSVAAPMMNDAIKKQTKKRLSELMNQDELDKLKKALEKKNIHIDNLENKSSQEVYRKYEFSAVKRKDMSTFLDAYLFGIGKQMDKTLFGIESYAEQNSLFDDLKEDEQKDLLNHIIDTNYNIHYTMDQLMKLYLNEDVEGLYDMLHGQSSSSYEYRLLTRRNYIMDKRIDSLIKKNTAFICVGSGHLGGKEGLIALLSKRGYSVKPMKSPRTGLYKKMIPQENLNNWKTIVDENGGYSVKMPGEPTNLNVMGAEMKGYIDFGSGHFYMSTAMPYVSNGKKSPYGAAKEVIKRFEDRGEVYNRQAISFKGMQGYDVEARLAKEGHYAIRVLTDSSRTFLLMIGVANVQPSKSLVKNFFESLEPRQRVSPNDIVFTDDTASFRITVPSTFKASSNESLDKTYYKTYTCMDYNLAGIISVTYVDYAPGMHVPDVEELFDRCFAPVERSLEGSKIEMQKKKFSGYPSRDYRAILPNGEMIVIRYVLRGPRLYAVSVTSKDISREPILQRRLAGFEFKTPARTKVQYYTSEQGDFKVLMPGKVVTKSDTSEYSGKINYQYGATDPYSNQWLKIYSRCFKEYDHLTNDSSALAYFVRNLTSDSDTLLDSSVTDVKGRKHYTLVSSPKNNRGTINYGYGVLNGLRYYMVVRTSDTLNNNDSLNKAMLNSFEILKEDKSYDIFRSKTTQILKNLTASDSLTHANAKTAMSDYNFKKSELPELQKALAGKYIDDDSAEYNSRYYIYRAIFNLQDSAELFKYVKENYLNMPDKGNIKTTALRELANSTMPGAPELWKELVLKQHPKTANEFTYVLTSMAGRFSYDSVPAIGKFFPDLFALADDSNTNLVLYNIAVNALNRKFVAPEVFLPLKEKTLRDVQTEYAKAEASWGKGEPYYPTGFSNKIEVLNYLPASEAVTLLNNKIVRDTFTYDKISSFCYLLKNNMKIENGVYKKYLEVAYHRNELYQAAQKIERTAALPAEMKKQKYLAEGDLMAFMEGDETYGTFQFVQEKKMEYKGVMQRFFIYKVKTEENVWFGMAGPYPLKEEQLVPYGSLTRIYYEDFDSRPIEEFMKLIMQEQ